MNYLLHEILHMSLFLSENWNNQILENPYFNDNKYNELYKRAFEIGEQMSKL